MRNQWFIEYNGDLMGLPITDNHLVFRWARENMKILFSVTRYGNAASIHLASDKKGLRFLKEASNDFCSFILDNCEWCKMIIGMINKKSIERLAISCGFSHVASNGDKHIYARCR